MFTIPTFRQVLTRVMTDLGQFSDGTVPRRSVEYFLSRGIAGAVRGLYAYLSYILRQAFADTADETNFWHWFDIFGLTRKPAEFWVGTYRFTGTDGEQIDDQTQVQRADGALYTVEGTYEIGEDDAGQVDVILRAVDAGLAGNNDDGQELSLALPIDGVDPEGVVISTETSGTDIESVDDAKVRLLQHLKNPPHGGGPGDYVRWALEVPGFTRAWEFANVEGPNTVSVAAVRDADDDESGDPEDILPDIGERAELLAYLEDHVPITVTPFVIELTGVPLDVTLSSLTPDNPEVRAAIAEALADLLEREAEPGGTIALSRINEAISSATGETDHVMTVPATDVVYAQDEIGLPGDLTVL